MSTRSGAIVVLLALLVLAVHGAIAIGSLQPHEDDVSDDDAGAY